MIKSAGGRAESFYFAFGDHDVYGVAELPDNTSAAAVSGVINASGAVAIKLIPLITVEEVDQAVKKMPQYRAPGK
ncbi:MAG: GYD domain-containing protein [Nitrososphaerales archaeon]